MAYSPTTWHDSPDASTPINAARLNNIEQGIVNAYIAGTGGLVNADIAGGAAIAISKLASYPTDATKFLRGDGTWAAPTSSSSSGLLASRPAAASASNVFYWATDQAVLFFSDGASWLRMSSPAGALLDWMNASVPTGWVAYDGTTLGGSTGIYADLYAHLGNTTTLPDTRGRMTVAVGTHADVTTIGNSDGVAVGSRRPKHKHTVVQPTVTAAGGNNTNAPTAPPNFQGTSNSTGSVSLTVSGATVGPQTGSEPTDTAAYIVTLKIAKL